MLNRKALAFLRLASIRLMLRKLCNPASCFGQTPEQTIAFGRPTGVTVNYAPDRAVRYDLKGDPIEILTEAIRCEKAYLTIPPCKEDMSERIGKALGLR